MAYAFVISGPSSVTADGRAFLVYQVDETDVGAADEWTITGLPAVFTITTFETVIVDAGVTGAAARVAPEVGYAAGFTTAVRSLIKRISDVAQSQIRRELATRASRVGGGSLVGRTRATNDGIALGGGVTIPSVTTVLTIAVGHMDGEDPKPPTDPETFLVSAAHVFDETYVWSDPIPMAEHSEISAWLVATALGTNATVSVVCEWVGDGVTADGTSTQRSDDTIDTGTYDPEPYVGAFTVASGTLTVGKPFLSFPRKGSSCRIGVLGSSTPPDGSYSIRAQRLS